MIRIRLLAGLSADDEGEQLDVGPAKQRTVLAALALSVGEAVPVARLIDIVWGEDPPRTAEKTLQGHVAGLRKVLGSDTIVRTGAAYRLDLPANAIDVHQFRSLADEGRIDAALDQWRGTPLAGLEAPRLQPMVDALVEHWLTVVELDLERRVGTDPAGCVAWLTQLTAEFPFREGLWALLMTALYRSGRQSDALETFQRARRHLLDELGVEPGPRLQETERSILRHEPAPRASGRTPLPGPRGRVLGRNHDLVALQRMLAPSSVVTVVGPGGIGKTTLALAAATGWGDAGRGERTVLVDLAGVRSAEDVPQAAADALGVVEQSAQTVLDGVAAALDARPTLLLLDNCEHVIVGAARLATAVSSPGSRTTVLATSREGIDVAGEQLYPLGPLASDDAVTLFLDRAGAGAPGSATESDRPTLSEICRRLDGVPLAIELAAGQLRALSPEQLLTRLDDRLRLLTGGRRDAADRHRTLRATIEWSYELLDVEQRHLFERLSVFTGAFDLAAAEAVTTGDGQDAVEVDRLLNALVACSMAAADPADPVGRFRLLESLRLFAAERLASGGAAEEAARRHALWCRAQVTDIQQLLLGPEEGAGVVRLERLWPNLRSAVLRAIAAGDHRLADALVRPIASEVNLRRRAEIGDWAERILPLVDPEDEDVLGFWLLWAGQRYAQIGDRREHDRLAAEYGLGDHPAVGYTHAYAHDDGEQGLAASRAAAAWLRDRGEDHAADLVDVAGVGGYLIGLGRFDDLEAEAAALVRRHRQGPPTMRYFALGLHGFAARFRGQEDVAGERFAAAAAITVPAGTYRFTVPVQARIAHDRGERVRACTLLRDHLEELRETDHIDVVRMAAAEFVHISAAQGRHADTARVLSYLDSTGAFGWRVREGLPPDASDAVGAAATAIGAAQDLPRLDARQALDLMREVLTQLLDGR